MKHHSCTAAFLAVVLMVTMVGCQKETAPATQTIRIAAVAPLTGPQADVGQDLLNGVRLAVDERNARGGVLGRQIELIVFDDAADPKEAVSVAHKIASDASIMGVVGHMNSGTTKPASPVYNTAGIPVVMPVPTNPEITLQGFGNLFRLPPTDLDQGTDVARFALGPLGKKRFAVVHDSTAYGQPLADVFRKTVEAEHGEIVAFDGITEGDKDFRALLTRIRGLNPDALFFAGIYNEAGLLAGQARELGLKATFLAADGSFGEKFIEIAGIGAAEGAVMSFIAPDARSNDAAGQFAQKFRAKYGAVKVFAPLGYDAANILMSGISAAGSTDRATIVRALHSDTFKAAGVTGESSFAKNGDNAKRRVYFFTVKSGKFEPVPM
jgi:branched-chain amino acid transport system substrate-binding protein